MLEEILNSSSDNITAKANDVLASLRLFHKIKTGKSYPESLFHLKYHLEALGIKIYGDDTDFIPEKHNGTAIDVAELMKYRERVSAAKELKEKLNCKELTEEFIEKNNLPYAELNKRRSDYETC
jgi:hypothetical protein